jgi:hypothetical protein
LIWGRCRAAAPRYGMPCEPADAGHLTHEEMTAVFEYRQENVRRIAGDPLKFSQTLLASLAVK